MVVEQDGALYSIDNRRLAAAKVADIQVPVVRVDLNDPYWFAKFDSHSSGIRRGTADAYIRLRGTDYIITMNGDIQIMLRR
jgi:hypothetical protein